MANLRTCNRVRTASICILLAAAAVGCATRLLDSKQGTALSTAMTRAQAETKCADLSPRVVSRDVAQPSTEGNWVEGTYRAEFWISIAGCGNESTYYVICPSQDLRCFTVGPGGLADWE